MIQVRMEGEVSLARWESRADFLEVSLQRLDPSEWKLAVFGGFFREESITILEARSIAESSYPPGRLLILSDNLALVPALCTGRSTHFTLLSVLCRIFASGFRVDFVLSFRWIPSELTYSDKESRFFDCDYDSSKSPLHVLAQRLTQSSPAQTCTTDCFFSLTDALGRGWYLSYISCLQ